MFNKLSAYLPLAASAWFAVWLFWAERQPKSLFSLLVLGALLPAVAILLLGWRLHATAPGPAPESRQGGARYGAGTSWWLPMSGLLLSLLAIFIFLDRPLYRYLLLGAGAVLLYLGFFYALLCARRPTVNHRRLLQKINLNFLALTIFFSSAALFAWSIFIANIFWPLLLIVFLVMGILAAVAVPDRLFALVIAILSAQFFWVMNLWPVGFLIKGAVFSLLMYFLIYLARGWLSETFNRRQASRVFGLCLATAIIILLLARWI